MIVDSPLKLALGLGTGAVFGALLQKGQVGKYEVILDQLLLREGRVLRTMGTAVAVGSVGVHALARAGAVNPRSFSSLSEQSASHESCRDGHDGGKDPARCGEL